MLTRHSLCEQGAFCLLCLFHTEVLRWLLASRCPCPVLRRIGLHVKFSLMRSVVSVVSTLQPWVVCNRVRTDVLLVVGVFLRFRVLSRSSHLQPLSISRMNICFLSPHLSIQVAIWLTGDVWFRELFLQVNLNRDRGELSMPCYGSNENLMETSTFVRTMSWSFLSTRLKIILLW